MTADGVTRALWEDTAPAVASRPSRTQDGAADVVVLGAGITGLAVALLCAESGASVIVLEADRVAGGVSTYTTAKVSALHELVYAELEAAHGAPAARAYAQANRGALDFIRDWAATHGIDCALRESASFTYVTGPGAVSDIDDEVAAARRAGLDAERVTETPLPYPVAAAIRLGGQAELDSRAFCLGLADAAERAGARIFERTRATRLHERGGARVETDTGAVVRGRHLVVATHYPVFDRGLYFARMTAKRSYAIAARGATVPEGMFISADAPARSIRGFRDATGEDLLIVGGEGHTAGADRDTAPRYTALEDFARREFGAGEVTHRWSAQDPVTIDGLPYVGPLHPASRRVLVATGYRKWGLSNGVAAAVVLAARIAGEEHPFARYVDPARRPPLRSARALAAASGHVAAHMVGDRLRAPRSPTCTHLGCKLLFNTAESTWDCPCHGSRFATDGSVLEGPATRPLDPQDARAPRARD